MKEILEALLPMLVACDPLGLVPQFWALTEGKNDEFRRKTALESCFVALILGVIFAIAGSQVFKALGITINDFRIGGGIVFLIMAIRIVLGGNTINKRADYDSISIVPIATPLIVGPAVIANVVMLTQQKGLIVSIPVFVVAISTNFLCLFFSSTIRKLIGEKTVAAVSRVFAIMMVGIAVMFIRRGLEGILLTRLFHEVQAG